MGQVTDTHLTPQQGSELHQGRGDAGGAASAPCIKCPSASEVAVESSCRCKSCRPAPKKIVSCFVAWSTVDSPAKAFKRLVYIGTYCSALPQAFPLPHEPRHHQASQWPPTANRARMPSPTHIKRYLPRQRPPTLDSWTHRLLQMLQKSLVDSDPEVAEIMVRDALILPLLARGIITTC